MATFLRSFSGHYINVERIKYVVASRAAEAYYVHFNDGDGEFYTCCIPAADWLDYLGVPKEEQDARFEEDMRLGLDDE